METAQLALVAKHQHSDKCLPTRMQPATPSLLGLPSEIRLMILGYLLNLDDPTEPLLHCPRFVTNRIYGIDDDDEDSEEDVDSDDQDSNDEKDSLAEVDVELDLSFPEPGQRRLDELEKWQICTCNVCNGRVDQTRIPYETAPETLNDVVRPERCLRQTDMERFKPPAVPIDPYTPYARFSLHPQILATCRMLNIEGRNILYNNKTIRVVYYAGEFIEPTAYVFGEFSIQKALGRFPSLRQIKNWHVNLYADCENDVLEYEFEMGTRWSELLSLDEAALRSVGSLQRLELSTGFLPRDGSDGGTNKDCFMVLCNPFRTLRSSSCLVDIPGQSDLADRTKADILGTKPSKEPDAIKQDLIDLFNNVLEESDGMYWDGYEFIKVEDLGQPLISIPHLDQIDPARLMLDDIDLHAYHWDVDELYDSGSQLIKLLQTYLQKVCAYLDKRTLALADPDVLRRAVDEDTVLDHEDGSREKSMDISRYVLTKQEIERQQELIMRKRSELLQFRLQAGRLLRQLV
ncbi:hypothetical protein PMZ80_006439 [Knufia obscura]|uniref:F-box domain-containing protein n=2 Tax=Knufia TaxID=430999 RepID=A0AAN8EL95_9EURO|nr:hypothetical protein PMZ80_006439 [Knufia obscura]KAK5953412.1 hypothetical protein OHC33_005356 [Knufia fluminis]